MYLFLYTLTALILNYRYYRTKIILILYFIHFGGFSIDNGEIKMTKHYHTNKLINYYYLLAVYNSL